MLFVGLVWAGCTREPPPACVTIDTNCSPGYVPTFHNVWVSDIQFGCGATNSSCHGESGHQGGLTLFPEQRAYDELMAVSDLDAPRKRVDPGDPACSLTVVRIESLGSEFQMPPGEPLIESHRCAIIKWIEAGAPR